MARSFGIVEEKLGEAEFFFRQFRDSCPHSSESRFYFSAFVSAARSVTFALQATMKGVSGFESWYDSPRRRLKTDPIVRFFMEARSDSVHKGLNPLNEARDVR